MIDLDYQKINSQGNKQIKMLEKLKVKKYRDEFGKFMVENLAIIFDALQDGYDFESLFVTDDFINKHQEKISFLKNNSRAKNFYLIDSNLNKQYSDLDTPSGITAVYKISNNKLNNSSVIYLNGISDPGNLGTIMRSALAFGFVNLVLDKTCVDIYNSKVISAAKDSFFKLNIVEDKNENWLRENNLPLYATSSHAGVDLAKFKPAKIFCLVLGSESHGISEKIMALAVKKIKIEISSDIESLNVATAAAILLYELKNKF